MEQRFTKLNDLLGIPVKVALAIGIKPPIMLVRVGGSFALERESILLGRIILRIVLTTLALIYAFPHISGIGFHGDWMAALLAASVFNLVFFGLECLLTVIVLGINIGTLGLGTLITSGIKFVAALLAPSLALAGTTKVLPQMFQVSNYYQGLLVAGLVLGGLLFAAVPEKKKQAA